MNLIGKKKASEMITVFKIQQIFIKLLTVLLGIQNDPLL